MPGAAMAVAALGRISDRPGAAPRRQCQRNDYAKTHKIFSRWRERARHHNIVWSRLRLYGVIFGTETVLSEPAKRLPAERAMYHRSTRLLAIRSIAGIERCDRKIIAPAHASVP